jgi:hypothetical protein
MAQLQHGGPARRSLNVAGGRARRSVNVGGSPKHQSSNSFRITSLTDPTLKLPWNHIVTKNIGGRGSLEPLPLSPSASTASEPALHTCQLISARGHRCRIPGPENSAPRARLVARDTQTLQSKPTLWRQL